MVTQQIHVDVGPHRVTALSDVTIGGATPGSWEDAVATRDFAAVRAWYEANTGHEALGIAEADLTPGSLTSTHDGQVIEGVVAGDLKVRHNNVTYRGCRVVGGGSVGARFDPWHGASLHGALLEYCTFEGAGPALETAKHTMSWNPANGGPEWANAVTVRWCNMFGFTSGLRAHVGVTAEYNWAHDLAAPSGVHRSAMNVVGAHNYLRRNFLTSGGSSHQSMYFDEQDMHDIVVAQQILGWDPTSSVSYGFNLKDGQHTADAFNVRIDNNYFGPYIPSSPVGPDNCYQYGAFTDADVAWNTNGNGRSGNQWLLTGEPVANA